MGKDERQKRRDDLEMAVESEEEMEAKSSEKRWVDRGRGAKKLQTGYLLKGCHCQGCLSKMP